MARDRAGHGTECGSKCGAEDEVEYEGADTLGLIPFASASEDILDDLYE